MRLRWGPHASQLAERVVVHDPHYVLTVLDERPEGVLADAFRGLILRFDGRPLTARCARCRRTADHVCAYPGSIELIGACRRCLETSALASPSPALRIGGYEDALRHVAMSFRRGHRIQMRRMIQRLLVAKGGPSRLTEAAMASFFQEPDVVRRAHAAPSCIRSTGTGG